MPYKGPSIFDIHAKIEFFTPPVRTRPLYFPVSKYEPGKCPLKGSLTDKVIVIRDMIRGFLTLGAIIAVTKYNLLQPFIKVNFFFDES